jgi:predicted TIM-barrel fold metal-dependent hydrolase
MSEQEQEQEEKKKKKKKKQLTVQLTVQETEKVESALLPKMVEVLEELEKEKKHVDIQICPRCKSPLVRRVRGMGGDILGHMGLTPPKYECRECGWREKTVLKATNRPTTVREVVIMAEAKDADVERERKKKKR